MAVSVFLDAAAATEALGAALGPAALEAGLVVFLEGPLGAGKTTLVRGLLRGLGHRGAVRSPTYTLVEGYPLAGGRQALHLDLYRLADPEELEYLGVRELDAPDQLVLIEWAERGGDRLPPADLRLSLAVAGDGREAALTPLTAAGESVLRALNIDKALKDARVSPSI